MLLFSFLVTIKILNSHLLVNIVIGVYDFLSKNAWSTKPREGERGERRERLDKSMFQEGDIVMFLYIFSSITSIILLFIKRKQTVNSSPQGRHSVSHGFEQPQHLLTHLLKKLVD